MKIALFGGTFDPVHNGHLQIARRAARVCKLDQVLFVPSGGPPHKPRRRLTPFAHRLAMVALACAGESRFIPSLLEADERRMQYSVNTVARLRRTLKAKDRLFFLAGLDAFLDLPHWKNPGRLLNKVDFIVVARPGFRLDKMFQVVEGRLAVGMRERREAKGVMRLRQTSVHISPGLKEPIASRGIRSALRRGRSTAGLLPPLVERYIMKERLYGAGGSIAQ